jgi:hypothetical protein
MRTALAMTSGMALMAAGCATSGGPSGPLSSADAPYRPQETPADALMCAETPLSRPPASSRRPPAIPAHAMRLWTARQGPTSLRMEYAFDVTADGRTANIHPLGAPHQDPVEQHLAEAGVRAIAGWRGFRVRDDEPRHVTGCLTYFSFSRI